MENTIDIANYSLRPKPMNSEIICSNLLNPRGLAFTSSGDLLLIEAGAAEFKPPFSGRLTLRDRHTGQIKGTLLSGYRALNMQSRMLRDEIMGLADLAPMTASASDGPWLVAFTDYIQGSKLIEVSQHQAQPLFETQGNINSVCFHPERNAWYCIKPDTNEVVEFVRNQPERVLCTLPELALKQEAVPVNVVYDPTSQQLLISLFSGELGRGGAYKGIDFEKHQGAVVSVNPETGEVTTLVTGLTLPTALCLTAKNNLLVTELCEDFLQPLPADHIPETAMHGGFKRFSGRLLHIDVQSQAVDVLATELDTPSNIAVHEQSIYVSEGMGLPGRPLPFEGERSILTGLIRKLW